VEFSVPGVNQAVFKGFYGNSGEKVFCAFTKPLPYMHIANYANASNKQKLWRSLLSSSGMYFSLFVN